jgi:hypothetical protein
MNNNPLLKKLQLPGETFQLPSRGLFYTNGELDESIVDGEVHVHPGIIKPDELLAKDVDYLLTCLRLISFGLTTDVTWKHDCKDAVEQKCSIELRPFIANAKNIDPTTKDQQYRVVLPNGQEVNLRPPRYKEAIVLYQMYQMEDFGSPEKIKQQLLVTMMSMIDSVDGIKDREMLEQWVIRLPSKWNDQITDCASSLGNWGADFSAKVKCDACGQHVDVPMILNPINFFI